MLLDKAFLHSFWERAFFASTVCCIVRVCGGNWKLITAGTSTIFDYVPHMSNTNGPLHILVDRVSVLFCGTSTLRRFLLPVPLEPGIRLQSLHVFLGSSVSSLVDCSFSFFTSSRCEFINSSCTVNVHSTRRTAPVVLYNCMTTGIDCRTSTTSLMNCIGVTSTVLLRVLNSFSIVAVSNTDRILCPPTTSQRSDPVLVFDVPTR